MFHKRLFVLLPFLLASFSSLSGQTVRKDFHIYFSVFFPDALTEWTPDGELVSFVRDTLPGVEVTSVTVDGYASPTGTLPFNRKLSEGRAGGVADYFRAAGVPGEVITVRAHGEDWDGFFARLPSYGYDAAKVASIREKIEAWTPSDSAKLRDGRVYSRRKVVLQRLDGGKVYENLSKSLFPMLRRADVTIEYHPLGAAAPAPEEPALPPVPEPEPEVLPVVEPVILPEPEPEEVSPEQAARGFILCTNFVLDAGLIPNVGTVVPLGQGWALDLRYGGAWWSVPRKDFWWRAYGCELAVRKYFPGKKDAGDPWRTVTGHHLGLYGQFFTYDFELGGAGQMGGTPKMNIFDNPQYAGGVEYGYTFPLGRNFNLDLSLGAGYAGGLYHEYEPWEGRYVWRSTMRRFWLGPTRAEITLQWLLGSARNAGKKEVGHD